MTHSTTPLAITMGDPAGIGPEIVAKMLILADLPRPAVVLGDPLVMADALAKVDPSWRVEQSETAVSSAAGPGVVQVVATSNLTGLPPVGVVDAASGQAAYDAIIKGIELAKSGEVAGIVTAPIHKEAFAAAGITYPGHTEILADHGGVAKVAMMLANDDIRTVLVTIHMSLRKAIEAADFEAQMDAMRLADQGAKALGFAAPRVAVAGLNPHAGEGGLFGDEEITIIKPAIEAARAEGIDASGPWSGDTVFMQARQGRFDVVVAQYHDQGLIPVKYHGLEDGVNITLGLPFVRTSPDHGTAFDIAGQGKANHKSLVTAFTYADRLARNAA